MKNGESWDCLLHYGPGLVADGSGFSLFCRGLRDKVVVGLMMSCLREM